MLRSAFPVEATDDLLNDSVRLILSWQNADGGFGTYERRRAPKWMESLNPSGVFGDIMVEDSHVECTSSCVQALSAARTVFGQTFERPIRRALQRADLFLRRRQRRDGSFEGAWGVCFTYGTWFGISGLLAAGASPADAAVRRACRFLLQRQRPDGGWGEHGDSCRERVYVEAEDMRVSQTSWALSALVRARDPDHKAKARAAEALLARQESSGGWPREPFVGVFNRTCLINYDNYRHYFPLWALAEWSTPGSFPLPKAPRFAVPTPGELASR
jgi:lanosterol synthase